MSRPYIHPERLALLFCLTAAPRGKFYAVLSAPLCAAAPVFILGKSKLHGTTLIIKIFFVKIKPRRAALSALRAFRAPRAKTAGRAPPPNRADNTFEFWSLPAYPPFAYIGKIHKITADFS